MSMYDVKSIDAGWLGGEGFIAGKPVIRVNLGHSPKSRRMSAHQIAQLISSSSPMDKSQSAQWVAITGETRQANNFLLCVLRHTIDKKVYIETQGVSSMTDPDGTLPIWHHVCLRTELPADPEKIPMFHSVIVEGAPSVEDIEDFERRLNRIAYNGDRYIINSPRGRVIVKRFARHWRLTEPARIA